VYKIFAIGDYFRHGSRITTPVWSLLLAGLWLSAIALQKSSSFLEPVNSSINQSANPPINQSIHHQSLQNHLRKVVDS
jgi:hypothetical protein